MTDNGEVQIPSVKEEAKPSKIKKPAASDNPGTEEPEPKQEEPKPKQEEPKPKQEESKPEEPKPEEPKPEVEILEFHHDPIENARRKKLYDDYWNGSAPHPTDTRRPWEYINGWFR